MHCIFCGWSNFSSGHSIISLLEIQSFLTKKCIMTQFHYHVVKALDPQITPNVPICRPCLNWQRVRTNFKKKVFTPFDHLIMFASNPGDVQEPDHRCLERLVKSLFSKHNFFYDIIPYHVFKILEKIQTAKGERIPELIVSHWWKFNEHSQFLHNKKITRIIRRTQRLEKQDASFRLRWRH